MESAAASSGNLFVADGADNHVVEYAAPLASGAAAAIARGETDLIHKIRTLWMRPRSTTRRR